MELFQRVNRKISEGQLSAPIVGPVNIVNISHLTNEELLTRAEGLAADERASMCDLVETLAVIDERKLYREREYLSLFEYCVFKLRQSDSAAYRHIRAARAVRIFPPVTELLRSGKLSLESLVVIHPYLEDPDAATLVAWTAGKRVWEIERMVASRRTETPRRDVVRFVPTSALRPAASDQPLDTPLFAAAPVSAPMPATPHVPDSLPPPPTTAMVSRMPPPAAPPDPGVRIAFTADADFHRLLRETQAAMRHKYPDGRLDGVFRDAMRALLRKIRPWAYRKGASA